MRVLGLMLPFLLIACKAPEGAQALSQPVPTTHTYQLAVYQNGQPMSFFTAHFEVHEADMPEYPFLVDGVYTNNCGGCALAQNTTITIQGVGKSMRSVSLTAGPGGVIAAIYRDGQVVEQTHVLANGEVFNFQDLDN